jgi:hypothetical protein
LIADRPISFARFGYLPVRFTFGQWSSRRTS